MTPNEQTPLTPERLAEARALLRYESSISFHSARAKESMLLLLAEAEEVAPLRAELEGTRVTITELTAARDAATAEAESLRSQLADAYGITAAEWMQTQQQLITTLMARVAELEDVERNARALSSKWGRAYADHVSASHLDALKTDPHAAGIRDGQAIQYSDCANELDDVLAGEPVEAAASVHDCGLMAGCPDCPDRTTEGGDRR
ncbi:hypothetical protein [Streptomyces sp. NPDC007063]|uniref:hypothetical protein n=1 Tax=Streptomyces sp. NPDC007063 TaxID=3364772 RepID=UPI0036809E90